MFLAAGISAGPVGVGSGVSVVTGNESYAVRHRAAQQLGESLGENEIHSLVLFLQRSSSQDVLKLEELNALKNTVVNMLKRQLGFEDELAEHLMQMHVDAGNDKVWEDYCIQHLGGLFRKIYPDLRSQVAELFFKATDVKGGSLCGTALIALKTNAEFSEIDGQQVNAIALQVATSTDWNAPARITAIQICSQFEDKAILSTARQIMGDDSQDTMLRMSAIAAVGSLGNSTDSGQIARLCTNKDFRIKQTAVSAVERIEIRNQKSGREKL